jgi:hypothetical protein
MANRLGKPRCDQCFWWVFKFPSKTIDPDEGECRRESPHLDRTTWHAFPKTLANHWCGQWLNASVGDDPFGRGDTSGDS